MLALLLLSGCNFFRPHPTEPTESVPPDPVDSGETGETATPPPPVPIAVVSDGANETVLYIRLDTGAILQEVDFTVLHPELCPPDEPMESCVGFGIQPTSEPGGADRLLLTFQKFDDYGGANDDKVSAVIDMVTLTEEGPRIDWSVDSLDFTTVFGDRPDICGAVAACQPPTDAWATWRDCSLHDVHEVHIVEETAQEVVLWVADTTNPTRALKLRLTLGTTCAVVEEILTDETSEEWLDYRCHNGIQLGELDGEAVLLTNFRNSKAGSGFGFNALWHQVGGNWTRMWQHPPVSADLLEQGFLGAPHNADLISVEGVPYVIYAHSNGMGQHLNDADWTDEGDNLGSIGVLRLEAGAAVYLMDGILQDPPFGFLRDVDPLPDGTWLVTDSGCGSDKEATCGRQPSLHHVEMDLSQVQPVPGRDGRFSEDKGFQNLVEVQESQEWDSPLRCGFHIPYEADFLLSTQVGTVLSARMDTVVDLCSEREARSQAR